jgi:hypothetical protein
MEQTDAELVAALRAGDEETSRRIVREWHDVTPEAESELLGVFRSWHVQQPGPTAPDR